MQDANAKPETTADEVLNELRSAGWSVAVHNDYRIGAEAFTFWLLTHPNGRWVKGEGCNDLSALVGCRDQIARYSMDGRVPQPYAVSVKDNDAGNGWVSLGFNTIEQAQQFWLWADKELANATR